MINTQKLTTQKKEESFKCIGSTGDNANLVYLFNCYSSIHLEFFIIFKGFLKFDNYKCVVVDYI